MARGSPALPGARAVPQAGVRQRLRLARGVPAPGAVAPQLTVHRALAHPEREPDLAQAATRAPQRFELLPLGVHQPTPGGAAGARPTLPPGHRADGLGFATPARGRALKNFSRAARIFARDSPRATLGIAGVEGRFFGPRPTPSRGGMPRDGELFQ